MPGILPGMLSLQQIAACTGASAQRAEPFVAHLNAAMATYAINTPKRQAAFLAQLGHESAGLSRLVENLNYSAEALVAKFSRDRISQLDAFTYGRTAAHPADQAEIANRIYGGEWGRAQLGNTQPGDGWLYRARGPMGTTGRGNYITVRDRLRVRFGTRVPNFEDLPEKLADFEWGAFSAGDFWDMKGLNAPADAGNFELITRRINGGLNGYDDRKARWTAAKKVFGLV